MTSPSGTQAIDRAALLLTQVVDNAEPISFTELAAASGLAKSTTSRLLQALERNHMLRRGADGRYLPGELFVRYAWRGDSRTDLVSVARPYLERLGEQTGETINLGIAAGAAVEQVAQVDSRFMIGGTNWVGLAVPLHCSALGKVLLAYGAADLPPGRLAQRTERTITARAELAAELTEVRERGYAITDEELEPGLIAVAAPVFGAGRRTRIGGPAPVASISVSAPVSRLSGTALAVAAARCVAAAADLSVALGAGQPGNDPPGGPEVSGAAEVGGPGHPHRGGRRGNVIHHREEGAA